jgi:nitroreductase
VDVFEAIRDRRSIRKFKKDMIDEKTLNKIIEAGIWAPSAGNLQSWEVVVVNDPDLKSELSFAAFMRDFISIAPLVLVLCANSQVSGSVYNDRGRELYCIQDATIAGQNMLLAAHALGLGTCWIGAFEESIVVDLLGLKSHIMPIALIPVGYPDERPYPPPRYDANSFIHHEKY